MFYVNLKYLKRKVFIVDKISVIVPCFNEEDVLPLFYQEVTKVLESIENTTYELLFINDGSSDHTEDLINSWLIKTNNASIIPFRVTLVKKRPCMLDLKMQTGGLCCHHGADLQHPLIS